MGQLAAGGAKPLLHNQLEDRLYEVLHTDSVLYNRSSVEIQPSKVSCQEVGEQIAPLFQDIQSILSIAFNTHISTMFKDNL